MLPQTDANARTTLSAAIPALQLAEHADVIAAAARWSHRLVPSERDLGPGLSRVGGVPDLPDGWDWPCRFSNGRARPLVFIAQVALAETDAEVWDGPRAGLLTLFADWDPQPEDIVDPENVRAWMIGDEQVLRPRAWPEELAEDRRLATEGTLDLVPELTLPPALPGVACDRPGEDASRPKADLVAAYTSLRRSLAEAEMERDPRLADDQRTIASVLDDGAERLGGWPPPTRRVSSAGERSVADHPAEDAASDTVRETLLTVPEHEADLLDDLHSESALVGTGPVSIGFADAPPLPSKPDPGYAALHREGRALLRSAGGGSLVFTVPVGDVRAARFDRVRAGSAGGAAVDGAR